MYLLIIKNSLKRIATNIYIDKIVILSVLYVACKLTCNPLFFRLVNIHIPFLNFEFNVLNTILLFPILYLLINLIIIASNKNMAIFIFIAGIICEGFFSFSVTYATSLPIPNLMTKIQSLNTNAINIYGSKIWYQFKQELFAEIFINIFQIIIFSILIKKIRSFFISTMISVFITLVFYNIFINYYILATQNYNLNIAFRGISITMSILALYIGILSMIIRIMNLNDDLNI